MSLVFRREIQAENIHLGVVSIVKIFKTMNWDVLTQGVSVDEEKQGLTCG